MKAARWSCWLMLVLGAGCVHWKREEVHPKSHRESRANPAKFALLTILFGFAPLEH